MFPVCLLRAIAAGIRHVFARAVLLGPTISGPAGIPGLSGELRWWRYQSTCVCARPARKTPGACLGCTWAPNQLEMSWGRPWGIQGPAPVFQRQRGGLGAHPGIISESNLKRNGLGDLGGRCLGVDRCSVNWAVPFRRKRVRARAQGTCNPKGVEEVRFGVDGGSRSIAVEHAERAVSHGHGGLESKELHRQLANLKIKFGSVSTDQVPNKSKESWLLTLNRSSIYPEILPKWKGQSPPPHF
jgi:hypothetical protein